MVGASAELQEDEVGLTARDYNCLGREWAKHDPTFTWVVTKVQLLMVLAQLPAPLGFKNMKDAGAGGGRIEEEFESMLAMEYHDTDEASDTIIAQPKPGKMRVVKRRAATGGAVETLAEQGRKHFHFRAVCAMLARHVVRLQVDMPAEQAKTVLSMSQGGEHPLSVMMARELNTDAITVPVDRAHLQRQQTMAQLAAGDPTGPIDPRQESMWGQGATGGAANAAADKPAKEQGRTGMATGSSSKGSTETDSKLFKVKGGVAAAGGKQQGPKTKVRVNKKTKAREVLNQTSRTIV
jgi:hypothetical protein